MYTVKKIEFGELEIKKSKFITKLFRVNNAEEINSILTNIKKEYNDATHCCYAYIVDNIKKSSDDGEPGGTAGIPILQVLEKQNLNYVLCVVIRYFGGIKLGAGGLVRAYTKSVSDLIKSIELIELVPGLKIKLITTYEEQKKLDYILKNIQVEKMFNNDVIYLIDISKDNLNLLQNYNYEIIEEIYIEKEPN
jgi:uncharacterized YigZ family protein